MDKNADNFIYKYDSLRMLGADSLDCILTIMNEWELTEEQIVKLLTPNMIEEIKNQAIEMNCIKPDDDSINLNDFI